MKAEKCENKKVCYTWEYAALQMLPVTTIMNLLLGPPRGCLRLLATKDIFCVYLSYTAKEAYILYMYNKRGLRHVIYVQQKQHIGNLVRPCLWYASWSILRNKILHYGRGCMYIFFCNCLVVSVI
jgi:hypothetical protein